MIHPLRLLLGAAALLICSTSFGQTLLPANTIVTQNFNAMGSSASAALPANWKMSSAGTGSTSGYATGTNITATTQAASSGTPATGGAYNWATTAGTDRAIGFMTSASYISTNAIMAYYRNTTGATVNTVTIAFSIERYIVQASTVSVTLFSSTDGSTWTAQPAGDISTGDFPTGANAGTFTTPKTINKTVPVTVTVPDNGDIYFRWVFTNTGNTNAQGLGLDNVAVFAGTATPVLSATLKDTLQVDNGTPNQFNEGDGIRYQTVLKNTGTGDAGNVQITLPTPPANTTMVAGSVKTSAVAVNDSYTASFNTTLNASTVLVNDIGIPTPTSVLTYGPTGDATLYNAGAAGTTDIGGAITLLANGTFTYIPPTGFSGIDKFKYITGNGNLPNNDATVTITVGTDISFTTTNVDPLCNGGTNGSITINASGGNGTLTYSVTGAGGTYFASNVFTGLVAGTYNLAVKDAGGYIKTGTATLNNPAAIIVSGTIPALIYNTAMATAAFTKTGGTGTIVWSATGLPTGVNINSSTGSVTGTPTATGSFNAIITATDANACTGTKNVSFTVAPKLSNDAYNVVGNTQLVANGQSIPATPFTANATNILTNDAADAAITVTAGTFATTNGGSITIDAAGKFTYTPLNGSVTADSYTYTATSNGISATATINLTVAAMIWYVNNTYAGANGAANGSSHRPYTDVASAEAVSANTQVIYVHTGSGNTTGNALLKGGQILRGAGSALSVGALSIPAGTKPTLTGMITLASSVTVDGFDMTTGTTTAITATGATNVTVSVGNITTSGAVNAVTLTGTTGSVTIAGGTQTGSTGPTFNISGGTVSLTYSGSITQAANAAMVSVSGNHIAGTVLFQTGTLSATNGTGLQFDNADGIYNFNGTTTLNGGDAGIDILNGSAGTFSFASGTAITNPTNEAIKINAGTANVTYSGTFSKTNNAVNGILINGETGGTININGTGTKTLSTTTANAVNLTTNTGATINFGGNNLAVATTSGTGFNATGGGTVSVTGTGNIISSPTGTALNVVNTIIGASGLTFQSISSAGSAAANGIILNGTGSNGGLTITGTGAAGSGGTIANKTGGDGSTTQGSGIYLNSCSNISLTRMQLNDFQNFGIVGTGVTNFTLASTVINGINGTLQGGIGEGDVYFTGLSGAASVTNSTFSGPAYDCFHVFNNGETLNRITITGCSFAETNTSGNDAIGFQATGGTFNATIQSCTITAARSDLFQLNLLGTVSSDLVFGGATASLGNTLTNSNTNIVSGGGGVTIGGGGPTNNITFTFNISNNSIKGSHGAVLALTKGTGTNANFSGAISNNTIGTSGVAGSGSTQGDGIAAFLDGAGTYTVTISNNQIYGVIDGMRLLNHNGALGTMIATIQGNTIGTLDQVNGFGGIYVQTGSATGSGGDNNKSCFTIGGAGALKNSIDAGANTGGAIVAGIIIEQEGISRVGLLGSPNYSGGVYNDANVQSYVTPNNTFTGSNAQAVFAFHDPTNAAGGGYFGACPP